MFFFPKSCFRSENSPLSWVKCCSTIPPICCCKVLKRESSSEFKYSWYSVGTAIECRDGVGFETVNMEASRCMSSYHCGVSAFKSNGKWSPPGWKFKLAVRCWKPPSFVWKSPNVWYWKPPTSVWKTLGPTGPVTFGLIKGKLDTHHEHLYSSGVGSSSNVGRWPRW